MAQSTRQATSCSDNSYPSYKLTTTSYPTHGRNNDRPRTGRRPGTAATTALGDQEIICAISESRGISPTIGLSFVNLSTSEAVLCQLCDSQTYVRTVHKLTVFNPTEILFMSTAADPKSKLYSIVEENLPGVTITVIDRKYWAETGGHEYVQQLAFPEDVESLKVSLGGSYFAACCFAAVMKFIELGLNQTFAYHSLRIKYEPSEGSMMIDLSTIVSLELIQNLENSKSKDCLFGLLNETLTPMGSRLLRSNILQPSTDTQLLTDRYDAVEELSTKEEMFYAVRQALKSFIDTDRILTSLILTPTKVTFQYSEQCINHVVMLKTYVDSIKPIWQALTGARSTLLEGIREFCRPENHDRVATLIRDTLNEDVTYSTKPLDLRNQRTYAVKAGVNGFLDVARQTYKEANEDAVALVSALNENHGLSLDLKFESARQYYFRIPAVDIEDTPLPDKFINAVRRKNMIECQTLELVKLNQKISDAHNEVINMSDKSVQDLINDVRTEISVLFRISESIGLLDMIFAFAHLVTTQDYILPELTDTLAIKAGRHPVREKIHQDRYVPNDVYATQQSRFQIITGCNMSGKSTYIRSIALMTVMAQVGCFVPAQYASFPMTHQLFARVSTDDSVEANVSTFAAEMREMAFILRNIERRSMVIIDELGRGTSTVDGLAIAIAIAEALIESRSLIWFVTHFRDLARILAERNGVVNLHLAVDMSQESKMKMLYKISDGYEQQKLYGLALAKVVNLPRQVLEVATAVSQKLTEEAEKRRSNTKVLALARRRKLVLTLREQLIQAKNGHLEGEELREYLKKLQDEFVVRMAAIDELANGINERGAEDESPAGIEEVKEDAIDKEDDDDGFLAQSDMHAPQAQTVSSSSDVVEIKREQFET